MPRFTNPPWRRALINRKLRRQARVVSGFVSAMSKVMEGAVDQIIERGIAGGSFVAPALNEMYQVTENFYRDVIHQAILSCQDEKRSQKGTKHLSEIKIPIPPETQREVPDLRKVFKNQRYWRQIMKRSQKMTDRLMKSYLGKLRRGFRQLMPMVAENQITPKEAKKQMMDIFRATKPRVETIFRTETTNFFSKTQTDYFADDREIIGYLFDAVRDQSTTDICASRHGMVYRPDHTGLDSIAYNTPALHYNCRSHLIPLANTPENANLINDRSRDPALNRGKIKPLDPRWRSKA